MTTRLIAGVLLSLLTIASYAAYTVHSVNQMRAVETNIVERNRRASLQLIRIQSDLNALALAMRDMQDPAPSHPYGLSAWRGQFQRIRENLDDALRKETELNAGRRDPAQVLFLKSSLDQFWTTSEQLFATGDLAIIRDRLQPAQESLASLTARLLVGNTEEDQRASRDIANIYDGIERNAYLFLAIASILIAVTGWALIRQNNRVFAQAAELSAQRSELARQLITMQESTLRSISRDLHDEFGQILTALGAMLRRAEKQAPDSAFRESVRETNTIVQATLDKVRSLSQSLHPVMLEEQGLADAMAWYLGVFEHQHGIAVDRQGPPLDIADHTHAVQVFRILQEALNNVARHAATNQVIVRSTNSTLEIEDHGSGIDPAHRRGIGLTAMQERATLIGGTLAVTQPAAGKGTLVRLQLPPNTYEPTTVDPRPSC